MNTTLTATFYFPADTQHLSKLGAFLQFACSQHPQLIVIELAVTEVVVNAIQHGNAHECTVIIHDDGTTYTIIVKDDGLAYNPLTTAPLPMGELRVGGYGLGILHKVSDSLDYTHTGHHNQLKLTFMYTRGDNRD